MPVLLRPDGAVQVGWDPRRAVLVRPPSGLTAAELAALLRSMRSPIPITELQRQAAGRGSVDDDDLANLVAQLVGAGVATRGCRQSRGRAASIRVHGRGPLSDLLVEALRCSGARIAHSSQPHAAVAGAAVDLVVLSDSLVADPRMVRDLHSRGVAHLPVRVRDGTGLVGPLVIPGMTSGNQCPPTYALVAAFTAPNVSAIRPAVPTFCPQSRPPRPGPTRTNRRRHPMSSPRWRARACAARPSGWPRR